jgi:activating signal cointegrator 1
MKILTLWQPWASLIAHQSKLYETRSWGTDYRGLIAIHAAKRKIVLGELAIISAESLGHLPWEQITATSYPYGSIVAVCELTECLYMVEQDGDPPPSRRQSAIVIPAQTPLELATGLWKLGRYAWQFSNILKLPQPIPWKGSQGLTNLPQEAVDLINQQIV